MRIAIVTFWDSQDNYGQLLQAYALCRYLWNLGHTPFVVKYKYREPNNLKHWLRPSYLLYLKALRFLHSPTAYFRTRRQMAEMHSHDRSFDAFRISHIPMTEKTYDQYELFANPPEADAYMSGSDQIWSLLDPVYFLQFTPDNKKCLAYAPSCGGVVYKGSEMDSFKKYINRFSFIGLRESQDAEFVRKLGYTEAVTVVDPTMLLRAEEYDQVAVGRKKTGNYVLVYLVNDKFDFNMESVYCFAQQRQLEVKYIASQGKYDDYKKEYPTIEEWLGLMRDATYVITNSFHGMVFSLIFSRDFTVIAQKGTSLRMNGRVYGLLRSLGLEGRIFTGNLEILDNPIDYTKVNASMVAQISGSKSMLCSVLNLQ